MYKLPCWGQPCSTVIKWCVFLIELKMVAISNGRIVLKLITSASIPKKTFKCLLYLQIVSNLNISTYRFWLVRQQRGGMFRRLLSELQE